MKKNILKLLSLAAVAVLGWSCETDYFNEHNLDGWESDTEITDVQTIEYTLEAADYATIANNATNKATAVAAGAEAVAALEAVKTNCYFTSATDAETYLKAFVVGKYNNYFSNGSSVSVNYNLAEPQSQELLDLNAAKEYTLKNDDYKTVWGSDTEFESYVTPATMDKLAGAISSEGLEAGDYVVVTYNYSEEEPSTGGNEPTDPDQPTPDQPTYEYTSVLGSAVLNDAVTVTGYISAESSQGPILTDKGGSVLLYKTTGYEIGDVVTVSGTISSYNKGFQIGIDGLTIEKLGTTEVTYPTAAELMGTMMDELLTSRTADEYAQFVKVTGTVAVSGNYYNFNVDGATTAVGSIYGATDELKTKLSDGLQCTLHGYFISISNSGGAPKFVNLIITHVDEEPKTDEGGEEPSTPETDVNTTIAALNAMMTSTKTAITEEYIFEGVVLNDVTGGNYSYNNLILQAEGATTAGNGLVVYGSQVEPSTLGLNKGDKVKVTLYKDVAQLVLYSDMYEVTGPADAEWCKVEKIGTATITPVVVTPDQLKSYQSMLVTVKGATTTAAGTWCTADAAGSHIMTVSDASMTVYVKKNATDFVGKNFKATTGDVTGLVTLYKGAEQLTPRSIADVAAFTEGITANAAMAAKTEKRYGYFQWNGSAFSTVDLDVVQPTDYEAMNNKYGSITYPEQEFYIPKFLNLQYPYAKEGDTARVAYRSYNSGTTAWVVEEYLYDGSNWARDLHIEIGSAPYKKIDGNWTFDPSMTIVLNPDKSEFSKLYYMTAFEWVYNNKHEGYTLDNRTGNRTTDAEYYSGCAAGYTNLNWRINTLPKYYWGQAGEDITPYDNWSSEDPTVAKPVFELFYSECEKRFGEVMAATLGILHPNQRLIDGMDVIYTVQMMVYANASNLGSSNNRVTHAFEFKVVGDGQFEYVRMYALDPKFDLYYDFN